VPREAVVDEAARDALLAEVVRRLFRLNRELASGDFDELAEAMLMDIEVAEMQSAGRTKPCRSAHDRMGTVVPFPRAQGANRGAFRRLRGPTPPSEEA
jgi:hypothetical protein